MKQMKLTVSQRDWLHHAQVMGYDRGFQSTPIPSLVQLERLGLIERDPSSRGKCTQWRITLKGLDVNLGKPTLKSRGRS